MTLAGILGSTGSGARFRKRLEQGWQVPPEPLVGAVEEAGHRGDASTIRVLDGHQNPSFLITETIEGQMFRRKMVGTVRFELTTSSTPRKRATKLRYVPNHPAGRRNRQRKAIVGNPQPSSTPNPCPHVFMRADNPE